MTTIQEHGDKIFQTVQPITVKAAATPDQKPDKEPEKDSSTSDKEFPKTGVEKMALPVGIAMMVSGASLIVFAKVKKY